MDRDEDIGLTRRDFAIVSLAAGATAVAVSAQAAQPLGVVETDVTIKTPDGNCQAAFIHPTTGAYPGVIVWPDAFGLRPAMRDFGRRVAAQGYSVLVPNPFYRVTNQTPVVADTLHFNFGNQADMAKLTPLMGSIGVPGPPKRMQWRSSRFWIRSRRWTRPGRSEPRATAWADRSR